MQLRYPIFVLSLLAVNSRVSLSSGSFSNVSYKIVRVYDFILCFSYLFIWINHSVLSTANLFVAHAKILQFSSEVIR